MAEEIAETEPKPKKPLVKIIIAAVAVVVLLAITVVGTMFATGFFSKKPAESADEMLDEGAAGGGHGAAPAGKDAGGHGDKKDAGAHGDKKGDAKAGGPPGKLSKKSPELARFEYTYHQMDKDYLVNLVGSKKVMSVQIAIMTHYDERVIENVKKHDFALRSVVMDTMRMTAEADLLKPEFRKELGVKIRDVMNTLLEKYEDFGGIEEVFFTSFIVQ
jgi:flagellar FliL protein